MNTAAAMEDQAYADMQSASGEVSAAEADVYKAEQQVSSREGDRDAATADAEQAIQNAKDEAAGQVEAARKQQDEAGKTVENAEADKNAAEKAVEEADAKQREAEDNFKKELENSTATAESVKLAEENADIAQAELDAAREAEKQAVADKDAAANAKTSAITAKNEADDKLLEAEAAEEEAVKAEAAARGSYEEAAEREAAEQEKADAFHIEETDEYKNLIQAEQQKKEAQDAFDAARAEKDKADAAVAEKESEHAEAEKAKQAAVEKLEEQEAAQEKAQHIAKAAAAAAETARQACEQARETAANAGRRVSQAENDLASAESGKESAEHAAEEAARKAADAEKALEAAAKNLDQAAAKWAQGAKGFFEWLGFPDVAAMYDDAYFEDAVWKGNDQDATSLPMMLETMKWIRECNELRAKENEEHAADSDWEKLEELKIAPDMMAAAQQQLDWSRTKYDSTGRLSHCSYYEVGENIALGQKNPFDSWYGKEKPVYWSMINGTWDGWGQAGHYCNIISSGYTVTGFGMTYNENGRPIYGQTFSFEPCNEQEATYTVDEFEAKIREYMVSLNKDTLSRKMEEARSAWNQANEAREAAAANETAANMAVQEAEKALSDANMILQNAVSAAADAEKALQNAINNKDAAAGKLENAKAETQAAKTELVKAEENANLAAIALDAAVKDRETAGSVYADMESALGRAGEAVRAAQSELDQLDIMTDLKAARDAAAAAKDTYEQAIAALTMARENKMEAQNAVEEAVYALEQAVLAEKDAAGRSEQAAFARTTAQDAYDTAAEALLKERSAYACAAKAEEAFKRTAEEKEAAQQTAETARKAVQDALLALDDAENVLEQALDKQARADGLSLASLREKPTEDPDYAYLNDLVNWINDTEKAYETAKADLDAAKSNLEEREAVYDKAMKAYTNAMADAAIARDIFTSMLPEYHIINGDKAAWTKGDTGSLIIAADGDFGDFRGVMIDWRQVDPDAYEAKAGSTYVSLKPEYLERMTAGEHSMQILYEYGMAEAAFSVRTAEKQVENPDSVVDGKSADRPVTVPAGIKDAATAYTAIDKQFTPAAAEEDKKQAAEAASAGMINDRETAAADADKTVLTRDTAIPCAAESYVSKAVETGDPTNMFGLIAEMVMSGAAATFLFRKRKQAL